MSAATSGWRALGVAAAVTAAAALRWSTAAPLGSDSAEGVTSQLRLSFSARPERIERCTELTDEELSKLPAHMRLRTKCEGYTARYLLTIAIGDRVFTEDTLRGGGLRHDRPLHVFREHEVRPGLQRFRIEVTRVDEGTVTPGSDSAMADKPAGLDTLLGGRADRERDERARRAAEAMPERLVMDTLLNIPPMRVVLVTFDNDTRRLAARMER
jgi:hypothetical protein